MEIRDTRYMFLVETLNRELIPAIGCTEPIAVAYAAAMAREVLDCEPQKIAVALSRNIIKNIKSVTVPCTGGLKGIEASIAAGIVVGKAEKKLELLAGIDSAGREEIHRYLELLDIEVTQADTDSVIHIDITAHGECSSARVVIAENHTNIIRMEKGGEVLFEDTSSIEMAEAEVSLLTVAEILEFADMVDISDVREVIVRQIDCNRAVSKEGFRGDYGSNIGSTLLKTCSGDIKTRAKAAAAAGSDARMDGCELPVVIVSSSGNQGLTASLPVIEYAEDLGVTEERLIRGLVVSNLITIHLKNGIGRLSAYCGAVSAGAAAGAAIAYLAGGGLDDVAHTLVNALAITSGIICDGAKPSCAAKIAAAVDAGIFGYKMYQSGQQFYDGEGIVSKGVENTIANVSRLGKVGMKSTDKEITDIMLKL